MNNKFADTMLINIRIINETDQQLNRISGTHTGTEGAFPDAFSSNNVEIIQFQARPHLRGDILIDHGVKKSIFEAQFKYLKGTEVISFETDFSYTYGVPFIHRPPKIKFSWGHGAAGFIQYHSEIKKHSNTYPYNYSVDFFIR